VPLLVLWWEMNDRKERTLEEILSLFFETLYFWMAAYVSSMLLSYSDFLIRFASS
jgi:hypothetical protein